MGRSELRVREVELAFLCFGNIQVELPNRIEEARAQENGLGGECKCENVYVGIFAQMLIKGMGKWGCSSRGDLTPSRHVPGPGHPKSPEGNPSPRKGIHQPLVGRD